MKLKVLKYIPEHNLHECKDEKGMRRRVDIFVDGDLEGETRESIVGKTIECAYTFPYEEIAMEVVIAEEPLP